PLRFAFLAGVQSARTRADLKQPELADVAYEVVLGKFPKAKDLDKLLDEWALMNLRAERFERSDEIFKMLIEKTPNSPLVDNARLSLAESDYVASKLLEAKKVFQELSTSPKSDEGVKERAMFQLIEILTEQRAWADLLQQTDTFLKSFPNSKYGSTVSFRRSEALTSTDKFAEAETLLADLLKAKDDSTVADTLWFPRVWVLLAECHVRQKNYDKVVETVEGFRTWDPKNERLYEAEEVLGRAYKNQRQWDESRAAFERSLGHPAAKGTETAAKSQLMIAETYWLQENWKKAQENYLKVYFNYPRYPEWQAPALFQAGLCDEKLGDPEQAAKTYKELITKFRSSKFKDQAQERWEKLNRPSS
ncbi:MAG: tetratricopeptide repeat protein, partial [Planctomycetaceae bacterium]|nr:tetratricopeptide repeat protein [Planctomycetaceae bacterium]